MPTQLSRSNDSSSQIGSLLKLDDIPFLKAIVARYPETMLLAGAAEATPEGNPKLKPDAMTHVVFDHPVDEAAIEAERTFVGLVLFKAVLNGARSFYPHLSPKSFNRLRDFTLGQVTNDEDREFILYSLACNDLGKTQALIDANIALTGRKAPDHDRLMAEMVEGKPGLFSGLQWLTAAQQDMFRAGLNTNFNLGQTAQGENLPSELVGIQALDPKARMLRLVAEFYDFAGATGHVRNDASMLVTEDNLSAYMLVIEELTREPLKEAYQRYILARSAAIGIRADEPDSYVLGRIAALSRSFTRDRAETIRAAWRELSPSVRDCLKQELANPGTVSHPAIMLYYAPSVIANAEKSFGNFERGLDYSLRMFARQFETTRTETHTAGEPVIMVNVAGLAREALQASS